MKKAVIYDRASTAKQKDNWSRDDALREGAKLAESSGYEWELRQEVKSGESLINRPVMMGILNDIEAGKIHAIICQELNRLSRDEDSIDGLTIRQICRDNNVIVITQSKVYDFSNEQDDTVADFEFLMGKFQKRAIKKQTIRGMKAKAKQGGFNGGPPPLGYKLGYHQESEGEKPKADYAIEETQTDLVKKIFELYIEHGGHGCAKELNQLGYRTQKGGLIRERFVQRVVSRPIYAGFVTWGRNANSVLLKDFETPMVYRPELQIIPVETWQLANDLRKKRSRRQNGVTGKYPFSGLLRCPYCSGVMYGHHQLKTGVVSYRCQSRAIYETCRGKQYSAKAVAMAVIPFLADTIKSQVGLTNALEDAASQYGKTITEAELEQQTRAELLTVKEAKARVVKAISAGLVTDSEAKSEMDDLRAKETRLTQDLATIGKKEQIKKEYLEAIKALQSQDVEQTLWTMLEEDPNVLKRITRKILASFTIKITGHLNSKNPKVEIDAYEFTEEYNTFCSLWESDSSIRYYIDLSQLLRIEIPV